MHEASRTGGANCTGRSVGLRGRMLIPSAGITRIRFDGSTALAASQPEGSP